jgi:hypothetical protein
MSRSEFKPSFVQGDMIVGVRFETPQGNLDDFIRSGNGGTFVVDLVPVAGPIYHIASPFHFGARCESCGERSDMYKRKTPAITSWAHTHRCPVVFRNR